ncbi:hypothetical protein L0337_36860 [candidate division KSB1 bacterium]|nr:hypothetical protein [candidate division KSB1 bacterium]
MQTQFYEFLKRRLLTAHAIALFFLVLATSAAMAQMQAQKANIPTKLVVQTNPKQRYWVGDTAEIEVALQDANNKAAPAIEEVVVELELLLKAKLVKKVQDTIKVGASSKKFQVPLEVSGLLDIRAKHQAKIPALRDGSDYIRVRRARLIRPPQGAVTPGLDWRFAAGNVMAQTTTPLSPSGVPSKEDSLDIKNSPQRTLLANGKDSATIHIFLYTKTENEEGVATENIRVRLFNSSGQPNPLNVLIPQGDDYGEAKLVSDQVGIFNVEYIGSIPSVIAPNPKKLQIKFGPPITQMLFEASPPSISLVDTADLIVRLVDEAKRPIATDTSRLVSFGIAEGRGEIRKDEITIEKGRADGRSSFLPTWRGKVKLTAATPNLPLAHAELTVELPGSLLGLSALGGLAGGLIAYLTKQGSKWWRVAIGLVSGFVLYWAVIFSILNVIPRFIALNPLSAFALSTLGGWLGTEVFNQILKLFKLPAGGRASGK